VKVESLIFLLISFFLFVAAIVYGIWSKEPIGTTALVLSGGLTVLVGGFFWFVSRRIDARPEDRKDAEIADGAGELGFFSPFSYWPFALGLCAALMGLALAFFYAWLIIMAGIALLIAIGGLLFEYYVGQNATHSEF
jgi:Cytochrome c oxidase subunit IV